MRVWRRDEEWRLLDRELGWLRQTCACEYDASVAESARGVREE